MHALPHIAVCICTYRRPQLLDRLLTHLNRQHIQNQFRFSVVVSDNDAQASAKTLSNQLAAALKLDLTYCLEPRKNISLARNCALAHAKGDFIAFIDDDEFPARDWLLKLFEACCSHQVAGVFGPVRPHFDQSPPAWLLKGRFCERTEHPTGFVMPWNQCRTGNVLFKRSIIDSLDPVFRPQFGAGAQDIDLFRRLIDAGHTFIWCNEAVVHEVVPPHRWKRSFMLRRALLRGNISLQHPQGRCRAVAKAVLAVPLYAAALPFLLLAGHHHFMKYLVKLADHGGRLLALLRLNPITERET